MRLEIRDKDGRSEEAELLKTTFVIGRDAACDIVLSDKRCSRRHVEITQVDGIYKLRDLGSANGITRDGVRLTDVEVFAGDILLIGDTTLRILPEDVPVTVAMSADQVDKLGGDKTVLSADLPKPRAPMPAPPKAAPAAHASPAPKAQIKPPAAPPASMAPQRPASAPVRTSAQRNSASAMVTAGGLGVLGLALIGCALALLSQFGAWAFAVALLGFLYLAAGVLSAASLGIARVLRIGLYGLSILLCALSPMGAVGLFRELRPQSQNESDQNDGFLAVALGVTFGLAIATTVALTIVARVMLAPK